MQKLFALVAAAVLLATAPSIASEDESWDRSTLLDKIVYAAGPDHPGGATRAECSDADAVEVVTLGSGGVRNNLYCTTGSHTPAVYSITHGPDLTRISSDFTGVVQSIVQYQGGERRWSCNFSNGAWLGCSGAGSWPGQAVEFCHDTWAYSTSGQSSVPLFTGFAPGCPNGDVNVGGTQLGANTQPNGDGIPTGSWAAYVIHG
jgi:hypothetical protein